MRFAGDPGTGKLFYGSSLQYGRSLEEWESRLPRRIGVHRTYFRADQVNGMVDQAARDLAKDRLPFCSIKPPGTWAAVASGRHDAWLTGLLDRLGSQPGPIYLAIHHEPENDFGAAGMQPADWVAMQERTVREAAQRTRNVTVVPVLMQWTFSKYCDRNPKNWLVPSATVFGFDLYNAWSPDNDARWRPFGGKCDTMLPYTDGKPLVVGEYGCRSDKSDPGRGAEWLRDAYDYALANNVVCLSYFNSGANSPDGTWELDGRREDAFAELLGRDTSAVI